MTDQPIEKYKVISHRDMDQLADLVNDQLGKKWVPLGGPCYNPNGGFYVQAMVQYG